MAIRIIRLDDDPILRKKSRRVESFDSKLWALLDDMRDTLAKADGAGLAAVQVGVLKRVVVIDCSEEYGYLELINPEIIASEGKQLEYEACLSLPHKQGITMRPMCVKVKAQDRNGQWHEYSGSELLARCFCHELDHLDGVVFTDRIAPGEAVEYME